MKAKPLSLALLVSAAAVALACGKTEPKTPPPTAIAASARPVASVAPPEVHERVVPHVCAARKKVAQLLGQKNEAPMEPLDPSPESAPPPSSVTAGATRIPANQAYRVIAPSTVLLRTDNGMGTGVVIDPRGYVLTNHHVVADGRKNDFVISVKVTLGDLAPTGRMVRQAKTYEGVVVKSDPVRDIAIVKIKDPPPKLEVAKLARSAPQVAEKVIAVGHAGIGFLWAAKTCSVATIGERQSDVSMLAAFDCANVDPAAPAAEAAARKTRCDEAKKRMTDALNASTQGLAIQTDCAITHGDSGGPLVNVVGEIVGLNQSIAVDAATVSFHVHLDELREFVAKYPEEGAAILPDPYCDGGFNPTLEDIDLDGVPDTLVTKGGQGLLGSFDKLSLLIDLDEDQGKRPAAGQAEFFDAELALLTNRETTYVWYDTVGDNRFDVLLVDKDSDGKPDAMYHLDADGRPTEEKDKAQIPGHDFSARFVKDPALHVRLAKIAQAIGGTKLVSAKTLAAASASTTLPDALLGGGTEGRLLDTDANGRPDVAAVRGAFSRGFLVDADEDSLGALQVGSPADAVVKAKKVDAEVGVVVQGTTLWAQYDTDNDGKFDLALVAANGADPTSLVATSAWRIGEKGELALAPEHVGRKLLRPGLLPQYPRVANAFRNFSADVAADEGMGSFPDPFAARGRFHAREVKGVPANAVVESDGASASVILVDVDRDTKLPPKDPDFAKLVADGKLDAEVAIVHRGLGERGADWVFYDTDADGKFDLVLYVPSTNKEVPAQAWRLVKDASARGGVALQHDPAAVPGKPMRHRTVFKDKAMGAKWRAIAEKLFNPALIEP